MEIKMDETKLGSYTNNHDEISNNLFALASSLKENFVYYLIVIIPIMICYFYSKKIIDRYSLIEKKENSSIIGSLFISFIILKYLINSIIKEEKELNKNLLLYIKKEEIVFFGDCIKKLYIKKSNYIKSI